MILDVFHKPVLVPAHLEEVVALRETFDRPVTFRAQALHDITFGPEAFVKGAVPAAVVGLINQLLVIEGLQIALHDGLVLGIGRANEAVVGDVELFPEMLELRRQPVAVTHGVRAGLFRGLLHLLPMLVQAREKKHVVAREAPVPRRHIGGDGRIGMSDVRDVVDVVNGGGDVKGVLH